MADDNGIEPMKSVSFCSSLKDDVWHNLAGPNAFESWHFDAVSDDGREALVIAFYDNYVLSPRFTANSAGEANVTRSGRHRFPAVSFVYSVNGKPVIGSVNEFVESDFTPIAGRGGRGCSIAGSSFRMDKVEYGSGFLVTIELKTFGGRTIKAEIEWLLIESDLAPKFEKASAIWNAVAPRADVSGKISVIGRRGKIRKVVQFRGTGYHDQVTSSNVHYRGLSSRMWGRAHFVDSTLVFDRLGGVQDPQAAGTFYLIKDGRIDAHAATCSASEHRRDRWGLLIPRRIQFTSIDQVSILIKPIDAIRSGFSEVKMLSEITIEAGGKKKKTVGITEFVDPQRLQNRLIRWISDLRIGREDRSPLF